MDNFLVSVIIPTYNRAKSVVRAIDSVLRQSYEKFELIVMDDGSTDKTPEILNGYGVKIHSLRQENSGVSKARNEAVKKASGEWLAFLDSDDFWHESKLQEQVELIKNNPHLVWVHCDEIWLRNEVRVNPKNIHKKPSGEIYKKCLPLCCVSPSAVMIKKQVFWQEGGFREDFPVCEDYDLWLKLSSKYPIGFVPKFLLTKTGGHDDQLSKYMGLDLYRLKALAWQLKNGCLAADSRELTLKWLKKRYQILERGYEKHGRMIELNQLCEEFESFI